MGLDQYLIAEQYVSGYSFKKNDGTAYETLLKLVGLTLDDVTGDAPSGTVSVNVCYWRKANAIHKWFVDNCQGGIDDRRLTCVPKEKLSQLLELCKEIKANPHKSRGLLPTRVGFFFGSTEYGEGYMQDIEDTIAQLEKIFGNKKFEQFDFYYRSTW